jgi:hypothetical protein
MDRFYNTWNLKFGQVCLFDLPLLLIQNSYLNYSQSTHMPRIKRFSLYGHEVDYFIPYFYPYYYPNPDIIICNY